MRRASFDLLVGSRCFFAWKLNILSSADLRVFVNNVIQNHYLFIFLVATYVKLLDLTLIGAAAMHAFAF